MLECLFWFHTKQPTNLITAVVQSAVNNQGNILRFIRYVHIARYRERWRLKTVNGDKDCSTWHTLLVVGVETADCYGKRYSSTLIHIILVLYMLVQSYICCKFVFYVIV